jgi:hypothetical protein
VIAPLKQPVNGMKVRADSRTFVRYCQFESGIVVPNYIAGQVDLPHRAYIAKDSMICNFAQIVVFLGLPNLLRSELSDFQLCA